MTSLNPYHVKQCKAYLSVLYPQFSTNEIEITAASRQNQHPGYTKPHTIWFVAVWVKRAVDEQPAARLLEAGPELATPEMALKTYIEQCLQPAINALTAQHLLSTPMTRKGHGRRIAIWPHEDAARQMRAGLESDAAVPPPPTYSQARESQSSVNDIGLP